MAHFVQTEYTHQDAAAVASLVTDGDMSVFAFIPWE